MPGYEFDSAVSHFVVFFLFYYSVHNSIKLSLCDEVHYFNHLSGQKYNVEVHNLNLRVLDLKPFFLVNVADFSDVFLHFTVIVSQT